MNFFSTTKSLHLSVYILLTIILSAGKLISGQNCGCPENLCCSQYGYCGLGGDYCGSGCQSGPCYGPGPKVSDIVSDAFLNGIANGCPAGKGFYNRDAFLKAAESFPKFATGGNSSDDAKREVAAFFAHVVHETEHLCRRAETAGGQSKDELNNLEAITTSPVISFKKALGHWMNNSHNLVTSGKGFGATIRAISPLECNGANPDSVTARVNYYREFCNQLRVDPGTNLTC